MRIKLMECALNFGESRVSEDPGAATAVRSRASLRVFWILCSRMRIADPAVLMEPEQDIILVFDDEVLPAV